jgi:hypothetical protein
MNQNSDLAGRRVQFLEIHGCPRFDPSPHQYHSQSSLALLQVDDIFEPEKSRTVNQQHFLSMTV